MAGEEDPALGMSEDYGAFYDDLQMDMLGLEPSEREGGGEGGDDEPMGTAGSASASTISEPVLDKVPVKSAEIEEAGMELNICVINDMTF